MVQAVPRGRGQVMDGADVLFGAVIAVGSILLTVLAQSVAGWMEWRLRRNERRQDFRRETLLALQDALDELARNGAVALVLKARPLPIPGMRKDVRYDNPHAQAAFNASIRMTTLMERVSEAEIRDSVKRVHESWRAAVAAQAKEATHEEVDRMRTHRHEANERIGKALRLL